MNRIEQLTFCKVCTNRKFDPSQGIICGLTSSLASFSESCPNYVEDTKQKKALESEPLTLTDIDNDASKGQRFANYILDLIFIYCFTLVFGFLLGIILVVLNPELLDVLVSGNKLIEYLLGAIFVLLYYILLEGLTGRTIAKLITKTKVVTIDNKRPPIDTIIVRSLCRLIPFEAFSFLGTKDTGWHDTLSKTRVVKM